LFPIVFLAVVFVAALVTVLGTGLGVGWALQRMLPQLDLGFSLLIGTVAGVASLHFAARLILAINAVAQDEASESVEDRAETRPIIHIIESAGLRSRRKRVRK